LFSKFKLIIKKRNDTFLNDKMTTTVLGPEAPLLDFFRNLRKCSDLSLTD